MKFISDKAKAKRHMSILHFLNSCKLTVYISFALSLVSFPLISILDRSVRKNMIMKLIPIQTFQNEYLF